MSGAVGLRQSNHAIKSWYIYIYVNLMVNICIYIYVRSPEIVANISVNIMIKKRHHLYLPPLNHGTSWATADDHLSEETAILQK